MKTQLKRTIALLSAIALLIGLMPAIPAFAINDEAALRTALSAGGAGATVQLTGNITLDSELVIERDATLDLNGYTLSVTIPPGYTGHTNAIRLETGVTFTIEGAGGGMLHVTHNQDSFGVGGGHDAGINTAEGTLYINSGTINVTGGRAGAGIGGGAGQPGGNININGGTVNVTGGGSGGGGDAGAGIGGGTGGAGGNINILGGTVIVNNELNGQGAGIGGGAGQPGGNITVGGTAIVTALGGIAGGAGIGGGTSGAGGIINIGGNAHVSATGGVGGAGIGGGRGIGLPSGAGGTITITGGTVVAIGGDGDAIITPGVSVGGGAGIGGGGGAVIPSVIDLPPGDGGTVTISGGVVHAYSGTGSAGSQSGAAIGGGGAATGQPANGASAARTTTGDTVYENGIRTFPVNAYFRIGAAGAIGTRYFDNLQTAVTAAPANNLAGTATTIYVLQNHTHYNTTVTVNNGRNILFDLVGHTLEIYIEATAPGLPEITALAVDGANLDITDCGGEFNVTSRRVNGRGVNVTNASQVLANASHVTVTNATALANTSAAAFAADDSQLVILGDVTASGFNSVGISSGGDALVTVHGDVSISGVNHYAAVMARYDGNIIVHGDVTASDGGIYVVQAAVDSIAVVHGNVSATGGSSFVVASGGDSTAVIHGDVTSIGDAAIAVHVILDSAVTVYGEVSASGDGTIAANATIDSSVIVHGDVTASGAGSTGAEATDDSLITVTGDVSATGINSLGVRTLADAEVIVHGDVSVTGIDSIGANAFSNSEIIVQGDVTASGADSIGAWAYEGIVTVHGTLSGDYSPVALGDAPRIFRELNQFDRIAGGFMYFELGTPVTCIVRVSTGTVPVTFTGVTANGTADTETTTQLTLTFDANPSALAAANIAVSVGGNNLTAANLAGTGNSRTVEISGDWANGDTASVALANPTGYLISGSPQTVVLHRELTRALTVELHGGAGGPVFGATIPQAAWTIPASPLPSRVGYAFDGWALSDGGAVATYVPAGAAAVTLHALWYSPSCPHDDTTTSYNPATCTTSGARVEICDDCNTTVASTPVAALGHDMPAVWTIVTAATHTATGSERRECLRVGCVHYEEQIIPALPPVDSNLISITTPSAISITFAQATAGAWGLPGTVGITLDPDPADPNATPVNATANVTWATPVGFDPTATAAQVVTATGTLTLPAGVTNTNNVSLTVPIVINVGAPIFNCDHCSDVGCDICDPPGSGTGTRRPQATSRPTSPGGFLGWVHPVTGEIVRTADDDANDDDIPGDEPTTGLHILLQIGSYAIYDVNTGTVISAMDAAPQIVNGRTLIPVRFVAQILGATVDWNDATSEVTLMLGGERLTFAIGETAPGMDVPAQIIDARTFVPLRFISEFFGAEVNWYEDTMSVEVIR